MIIHRLNFKGHEIQKEQDVRYETGNQIPVVGEPTFGEKLQPGGGYEILRDLCDEKSA